MAALKSQPRSELVRPIPSKDNKGRWRLKNRKTYIVQRKEQKYPSNINKQIAQFHFNYQYSDLLRREHVVRITHSFFLVHKWALYVNNECKSYNK